MIAVGKRLVCSCHNLERYIVKNHPRLGLLCKEGVEEMKPKVKLVRVGTGLSVEAIQKQSKLSTPALKNKAQRVFNAWIRKRDSGKPCISCGSRSTQTASHFYSAGNYNHLRFNEDNVHSSCIKCNYYLSGNLIEYRKHLIERIGKQRVEKLDFLASVKTPMKNDRFLYIEIIEKYSQLLKSSLLNK